MRGGDLLSLTIQDFLEAISIYNHGSDLDKLLSMNPYYIVSCYYFFLEKTKMMETFVLLLILLHVVVLFLSS